MGSFSHLPAKVEGINCRLPSGYIFPSESITGFMTIDILYTKTRNAINN
jgi:hypothetical protein